jgi:hypothetical protein
MVEEVRLIGEKLSSGLSHSDRVQVYIDFNALVFREDTPEVISCLIECVPSFVDAFVKDLAHASDVDLVSAALRTIGYYLHHPELVQSIEKHGLSGILQEVIALLYATDKKVGSVLGSIQLRLVQVVCGLCLWCIGIQRLSSGVVKDQAQSLVEALKYGFGNPFHSVTGFSLINFSSTYS